MKSHRFGLTFKIFSIVLCGFLIVVSISLYQSFNVSKNYFVQQRAPNNDLINLASESANQKNLDLTDPAFLDKFHNCFPNFFGDRSFTLSSKVILDKDFNIIEFDNNSGDTYSFMQLIDITENESGVFHTYVNIEINNFSEEVKEKIRTLLRSTNKDEIRVEIAGATTLTKYTQIDENGNETLLPDESQEIMYQPTYLKILDTTILAGDSTNKKQYHLGTYNDFVYITYWDGYQSRITIEAKEHYDQMKNLAVNGSKEYFDPTSSTYINGAATFYDSKKVDGVDYVYQISTLGGADVGVEGYLVSMLSYQGLDEQIWSDIINDNLLLCALAFIFCIVVAYIVSRIIVRPIKGITEVTSRLANNDFIKVEKIKSKDELGELTNNINIMSLNLSNTIDHLHQEIDQVKNLEGIRREFIANFTHEIKTPLHIINGYIELLESSKDNTKNKEYGDIINHQIQKITSLIQAMLELSKLESKTVIINKVELDLEDLVVDCIDTFEQLLKDKQININFSSTPTIIKGDKFYLEQVIMNYLSNALKHTSTHGTIYIVINDKEFSIENEGKYIEEEKIKNIWEVFVSHDENGTGLGLAIVKNILELHEFGYGVENTKIGVKFFFKY